MEKIEKTYNVKTDGTLTVVSEFGVIEIRTAEQNEVEAIITKESKPKLVKVSQEILEDFELVFEAEQNEVEAIITKESKPKLVKVSQEILEDFELVFEHEGADVRIEGAFKRGWKHWQKQLNLVKIHFLITVPQQYNVDLNTLNRDISVANLTGDVRARTSGGSLCFENITGEVFGHTSGGSIETVNVTGDVQVRTSGGSLRLGAIQGFISGRTSGGSIKVVDCSGGTDVRTSGGGIWLGNIGRNVTARTSGGSIQAAMTTQPQSECSLRTSGGAIICTLIPDVTVDVEAKTSGGRVSTDFAVASVTQEKVRKNRLRGSINGGGPLLKLRTSGGNIHLQKAEN